MDWYTPQGIAVAGFLATMSLILFSAVMIQLYAVAGAKWDARIKYATLCAVAPGYVILWSAV